MEKVLREKLPDGEFKDVSAKRSRHMSSVKGRGNRTTELTLRMALVRGQVSGWVLHPKGLPGNPDFFFPAHELAIFVDGCFWHGCPECGHVPKKNRKFWRAKIERNRERDIAKAAALEREGIAVLRFWEHDLQDDLEATVEGVRAAISAS